MWSRKIDFILKVFVQCWCFLQAFSKLTSICIKYLFLTFLTIEKKLHPEVLKVKCFLKLASELFKWKRKEYIDWYVTANNKKKTLSFVNLVVTTLIKVAHKCFQHFRHLMDHCFPFCFSGSSLIASNKCTIIVYLRSYGHFLGAKGCHSNSQTLCLKCLLLEARDCVRGQNPVPQTSGVG